MESLLVRTLKAGQFAITAEVTPPVAADAAAMVTKAEGLRGVVDAVNVTDAASARVHMSSLAAASILAAAGIEPVLQLTCRDRNRIALQSDLLGAGALGIRNLLILRGDDPSAGDEPEATGVFDYQSRDLIGLAREMRDHARLPSGRAVEGPPQFFIGAADTPLEPAADWQPTSLTDKADAGAQFVQTQFCFDMALLRRYMARLCDQGLADRLFFLIGIGPLASARSARWMRDNLWGTVIPDALIDRLDGAADAKQEGIRICAELLCELADIDGVSGAHLMAPNNTGSVPAAIAQSGLRAAP